MNHREHMIEWMVVVFFCVFGLTFLITFSAEAQTREEIESVIRETAEAHEMEPDLVLAIATVESGLDPNAVGSLGEIGVFQLRPEFHDVKSGDVRANANTAVEYLKRLKLKCKDYGPAFYVCFNHGPYKRVQRPTEFPYYIKVERARRVIAGEP